MISRTETTYLFTWTDTLLVSGSIIQWYCVQVQSASGLYDKPCVYNGTFPASGVSVLTSTIVGTYGYHPGSYITARVYQKRLDTATIQYSASNYNEEIAPDQLIDKPGGQVTGLTVASSTRFQVVIAWNVFSTNVLDTGNSPITGYLVERSCSGCAGGWLTLSATATALSQTILLQSVEGNQMTYNTNYQIRVTPINICGLGTNPATISLLTKAQPSAPLVAPVPVKDVLSSTLIKVSWSPIGTTEDETGGYPVTSYQLLRAISPVSSISSYTVLQDSLATSFSQTSGWTWSTTYAFAVRATNTLGLGVISTTVLTLTTAKDPALCVLPTGMNTPAVVDVNPTSITVKWDELTDSRNGGDYPIFYLVEYSPDNTTWTALNTGGTLVFQFTHTVATAFSSGVKVYYRVKAQTNVGLGSPSSSLSVVTDKVPQSMTAVKTDLVTPTDITISWTSLTDIVQNGGDLPTFYSVEWYRSDLGVWQELNTGGALALTYTHTYSAPPFPGASTQQYRVRPKNGVGFGIAYSNTLSVLCDDVPQVKVTVSVKEVNPRNITIQWTELTLDSQNGRDLPTFYLVEYTTTAVIPQVWTPLNDGQGFAIEYMHSLANQAIFDPNIQYLYRVRAKNGVGYAPLPSASLTVSPDNVPQGMYAPYLSGVSTISGHKVMWNELTDITLNGGSLPTFYSIEHSANNNAWVTFTNDTVKSLYFFVNHNPGTILTSRAYYRVRAENEVGMANVYSSVLTVKSTNGNYTPVLYGVDPVKPKTINLAWSEWSDMWSGTAPTFYQVEWLNPTAYGTSCDQVPTSQKNNLNNPATTSGMSWQIVSLTSGAKFTEFLHTVATGIFPNDVFPSGSYQCYRVRMHLNGIPFSTPTGILRFQADKIPYGMHAPTVVTVNPYNVSLQWKELIEVENGGDLPIFYQLEWYNYENPAGWVALTHKAIDGKVLQYTHVRTGSVYSVSQQLKYRVIAENGVGMGSAYSSELVLNPDTNPSGMGPLSVISVLPQAITIGWAELDPSLNGGDAPYYYQVEWWDEFQFAWTVMTDESIGTKYSFTHVYSDGLFPPDTNQKYRVLPKNLVGWGTAYSPYLSVLTDTTPSTMNAPILVDVMPTQIKLAWTPLLTDAETGRDPIIYYRLEWDQGMDVWTEISSIDDGLKQDFTFMSPSSTFDPNINLNFRLIAKNNLGFGPSSTNLVVLTDGPPTKMNIPTATLISPKQVNLKWNAITSAADTGRDPITYYKLEFLQRPCYTTTTDCLTEDIELGVWTEITTESQQKTTLTFNHMFTMVLKPEEIYYYRVCPKNGLGFGVCSDTFTFLSDTTPKFMFSAVINSANITPTSIKITWNPITSDADTGRDPANFYDLQWDQGTGDWVSLIPESSGLLLTYTQTPAAAIFPSNVQLSYRIRARNGVGYGVYSAVTTIVTDSIPPMMYQPSVAKADITPLSMVVTWPSITDCSLGGNDCPIYYGLQWDQGNGNWVTLNSEALGLINTYTVKFSQVFPSGQQIQFRTFAKNNVGIGEFSPILITQADQVPQTMTIPTASAINPTYVTLNWVALTLDADTGGDPPIYYELSWDQGIDAWQTLTSQSTGLKTSFIHSAPNGGIFPGGILIKYRLRAKNGVGFGVYGNSLSVLTDEVPQFMNPPLAADVDINPKSIRLTWSKISLTSQNGRDTAVLYELQWYNDDTALWEVLTQVSYSNAQQYTFTRATVFPSGSSQQFRARAKNGVGFGAYSTITVVIADEVPTFVNPPNAVPPVDITPTSIRLTWTPISSTSTVQTGRDPIIYYELQWLNYETSQWDILTAPTGSPLTEFTFVRQTIFPSGSSQVFRLRGMNGVGLGAYSAESIVIADSVPTFMYPPSNTSVTPTSMSFQWLPITTLSETGGDPAIYYELQWDQGQDLWTVLTNEASQGISTSFTFNPSTKFGDNIIVKYRLRAKNGVGLGEYSAITEVLTDSSPKFMFVPQINYLANDINPTWIKFTWPALTDYELTGRDSIIYYQLEWYKEQVSAWIALTTFSQTIMLQHTFTLPAGEIFPSGSLQRFRLRAQNKVGLGLPSDNLDVTADSVPQYMNIPQVDYALNNINPNWILLTWTGITDWSQTGGDAVIYYQLEWDQGTNGGNWVALTSPSPDLRYQFKHVIQGPFPSASIQKYRLRAQNGVGMGLASAELDVTADSVPLFMNKPQVNYLANHINPNWIQLTWVGITAWPQTGGDDVIYYELQWDEGSNGQNWVILTSPSQTLSYEFKHQIQGTFSSGSIQKYRLRAQNGVGIGVFSEILDVTADSVPLYMNQPQVDIASNHINPQWIQLTWAGISAWDQTGGDDIIYYELSWDQGSNGQNWIILTSESKGLQYSFNHTVPQPFPSGSLQKYRLRAKNGVGIGAYSDILDVYADKVPQFMNIPKVNYLANDINPHWIMITWSGISTWPLNGGDEATYYGLEWDQGKDQWVNLTTLAMGMIFSYKLESPTVPFESGLLMKFRAYAKNGVGYGVYSEILTINADTVPLRMNAPVEVQVDYNEIQIKWDSITVWEDTGGDDITYYKVEFLKKDCYNGDILDCTGQGGVWTELTSFADQGIKQTFSHKIPDTQHFSRDKVFEYRICAQNGVGMGACSGNTQILTDTIPQKMSPLIFVEVYHDQTIVKWYKVEEYEATGRSPVTKYLIQWDDYKYYNDKRYYPDNPQLVPWESLEIVMQDAPTTDGEPTSITYIHEKLPNFNSRLKIMYRIRAINNVGDGDFSEPLMVKTVDRMWSKAHSWPGKIIPGANASFVVPAGQNWTFNLAESPIYNKIEVNGLLQFQEEATSLHLQLRQLIIKQGQLVVGTKESPFEGNAKITLYGGMNDTGYEFSNSVQGGNKILANFGLLKMYGKYRNPDGKLKASANAGDTKIYLAPGLVWISGDKIALSPTNMRYQQSDYAEIVTYNNETGETTLDRPLQYYHYGAENSTAKHFSGVDMRGQVLLLSKNVQLIGEDKDDWGCQILTSSLTLGFGNVRKGQTFLDNVEIANCSQYGSIKKAALRFEETGGLPSAISNVALHHGFGVAVQIDTANQVSLVNNTIFNFTKHGINVEMSDNVLIQGNKISIIGDVFKNEKPLLSQLTNITQPAGLLGCLRSDCVNLRVLSNDISGVSYAAFVVQTHECGQSQTQQVFRDNVAHSINGWGAILFVDQKSFSQKTLCVEGSYFTAYKCTEGGIVTYNATLAVTFSSMVLIDNRIGGTIMIGDEKNENDTQIAIFRDSVFYGETEARDCAEKDTCAHQNSKPDECINRVGLMTSYFTKEGKQPHLRTQRELPVHRVLSDAAYGGESVYRNLTFIGFKTLYTSYCSVTQQAITLNPFGPDYHPRSKFFDTKFIDQNADSMVNLFSPPVEWIDFRKCGVDPCTGPQNTYLSFEGATFSGSITPVTPTQEKLVSKFQVTPNDKFNAGRMDKCSFFKVWNAYYCINPNIGILLFESRDDDKYTRDLAPVTISGAQRISELNTFMNHLETVKTQVSRLSRWPSLIQTSSGLQAYDIQYKGGTPPLRQRFTLVADIGSVIIRIKYGKAGAYILRDRQNKQFTMNAWDESIQTTTPIKGAYCGENRYDARENTLEFFLTPNCSIWIEGVDVIQSNLRLNWTIKAYQSNGGSTQFKKNLADQLEIKESFIKVMSVREGSVIIDFQITQAEDDPTFNKKGGLETVKKTLNKKIETQKLWVGAPILNATVTGQSVSTSSPSQQKDFGNQYQWDAKGNEVWTVPPKKESPDAQVVVVPVNNTVTVSVVETGSSYTYAIVIGVLLGVGVLVCLLGFFLYRRYKGRKEESDISKIQAEIENQISPSKRDLVNESVMKTLQDHVTIQNDEENHEEQYHPTSNMTFSYIFDAGRNYDTNRKANEGDRLMSLQDERRTRDQFYGENHIQPTFGVHDFEQHSQRSLPLHIESDDNEDGPVIGNLEVEGDEAPPAQHAVIDYSPSSPLEASPAPLDDRQSQQEFYQQFSIQPKPIKKQQYVQEENKQQQEPEDDQFQDIGHLDSSEDDQAEEVPKSIPPKQQHKDDDDDGENIGEIQDDDSDDQDGGDHTNAAAADVPPQQAIEPLKDVQVDDFDDLELIEDDNNEGEQDNKAQPIQEEAVQKVEAAAVDDEFESIKFDSQEDEEEEE